MCSAHFEIPSDDFDSALKHLNADVVIDDTPVEQCHESGFVEIDGLPGSYCRAHADAYRNYRKGNNKASFFNVNTYYPDGTVITGKHLSR